MLIAIEEIFIYLMKHVQQMFIIVIKILINNYTVVTDFFLKKLLVF